MLETRMTKIKKIIREVIVELFDPNGGNTYYAQGLDPKVVKLFEDISEEFYQSTLDDEYWKEISNLFPDYNSDGADAKKAVNYIFNGMKNKYPDEDWANIEKDIRAKILAGIT